VAAKSFFNMTSDLLKIWSTVLTLQVFLLPGVTRPSRFTFVLAARRRTFGAANAPFEAMVGSRSARKVTIASRKTALIVARRRFAFSRRPLRSTRFRRSRISAGVISVIGREAIGAATSVRSRRTLAFVVSADPLASWLCGDSFLLLLRAGIDAGA
jgi:hypothetical protein